MDFFNVISLLGGLAMFLYGMRLMGDSLKENSSGTLKKAMSKVTNNPLKAFVLGVLVTALIQSTTATIGAKEIVVSGITVGNKIYDGTTAATFDYSAVVLGGKLADARNQLNGVRKVDREYAEEIADHKTECKVFRQPLQRVEDVGVDQIQIRRSEQPPEEREQRADQPLNISPAV